MKIFHMKGNATINSLKGIRFPSKCTIDVFC